MKEKEASMPSTEVRPIAKADDLLSTELASGEVVVFDRKRNLAHCLNPAAAVIWRGCDGQRNVTELAKLLSAANGAEPDEAVVWMSVKELRKLALLEELPVGSLPSGGLTRREAISRAGSRAAAAAALIPIVATVLAPKPAAASSCLQSGASCTAGTQCCSGICASSKCV